VLSWASAWLQKQGGSLIMFQVFIPLRDDWGTLNWVRSGPIYNKLRSALRVAKKVEHAYITSNDNRIIWMRDIKVKELTLETEHE
jgi:hypothetical protein